MSSLRLYSSKGCTVVVGDLYITNLPFAITKAILTNNLKTITVIRGTLYIQDSPWLGSLLPLKALVSINGISLSNMVSLVDVRMPALKSLQNCITVSNCDRLCPARYTAAGPSPDDSGCANLQLNLFLHVEGVFETQAALRSLEGLIWNAVRNISGNTVC